MGRISDEEKLQLLQAADVALNPMFSGSGTNIKMFDFMAAGLPVISTMTGARGICDTTTRGIVVCEPNSLTGELARLLDNTSLRHQRGAENRAWVERDFAWEVLSPTLGDIVRHALEMRRVTTPALHEQDAVSAAKMRDTEGQIHVSGVVAPRIAILSTLGIRCGIAEYTTYMTEALLATGAGVTILANLLDGHEGAAVPMPAALTAATVERVWRYDNAKWTQSRVSPAEVVRLLRTRANRTSQYSVPSWVLPRVDASRTREHRNGSGIDRQRVVA